VSSLGSKAAGPIVLGVLIATSVVASLVLGRSLFPPVEGITLDHEGFCGEWGYPCKY
jgi:hypothetical protein